jgi:hypothetical protein
MREIENFKFIALLSGVGRYGWSNRKQLLGTHPALPKVSVLQLQLEATHLNTQHESGQTSLSVCHRDQAPCMSHPLPRVARLEFPRPLRTTSSPLNARLGRGSAECVAHDNDGSANRWTSVTTWERSLPDIGSGVRHVEPWKRLSLDCVSFRAYRRITFLGLVHQRANDIPLKRQASIGELVTLQMTVLIAPPPRRARPRVCIHGPPGECHAGRRRSVQPLISENIPPTRQTA